MHCASRKLLKTENFDWLWGVYSNQSGKSKFQEGANDTVQGSMKEIFWNSNRSGSLFFKLFDHLNYPRSKTLREFQGDMNIKSKTKLPFADLEFISLFEDDGLFQ